MLREIWSDDQKSTILQIAEQYLFESSAPSLTTAGLSQKVLFTDNSTAVQMPQTRDDPCFIGLLGVHLSRLSLLALRGI
jgi:hypothetical protein